MDYSTIERRSVINGSKLGNLRRQGAGEPPPAASWGTSAGSELENLRRQRAGEPLPAASWGTSAGSVMGDFPFMLR